MKWGFPWTFQERELLDHASHIQSATMNVEILLLFCLCTCWKAIDIRRLHHTVSYILYAMLEWGFDRMFMSPMLGNGRIIYQGLLSICLSVRSWFFKLWCVFPLKITLKPRAPTAVDDDNNCCDEWLWIWLNSATSPPFGLIKCCAKCARFVYISYICGK